MAAIDDVIAWANTLPAWQGDLVRCLLVADDEPLSPGDYCGPCDGRDESARTELN